MYCGNCGAQVPEQVKFCPECGASVNKLSDTLEVAADSLAKKVVLCSFPPDQKTMVMRLICKTSRIDLAQARSVIDHPNPVILDGLTAEQAEKISREFKSVGAVVDVLASTDPIRELSPHGTQASIPNAAEQLRCPICGSTNCTPIVETSSSGSDFSASKGCCGYIMLGPIGLLCGACGEGKRTSSTTYWVCTNCGNKFQK